MSNNISGFGLEVQIRASNTFPSGITITQFADDTDPFDVPTIQIADTGMGLNGDMVYWTTAVPTEFTLAVVPGGEDDRNLSILFENNRAGKGRQSVNDEIDFTVMYPNGKVVNITNVAPVTYIPFDAIASAGRKKSKPYTFRAEANDGA